ncbi:MAG: glycosyltransferase family 2 protein [Puniceicoccaceae bacterium]
MTLSDCSIIVPFYNEAPNVETVLREIKQTCPGAEVIAVDDGSTDQTWDIICSTPNIIGFRLSENRGQSGALLLGLRHASRPLCVTLDGDGQNDPADISRLLAARAEMQVDIICGFREKRRDTFSRRIASRAANRIRRLFIRDGVRDTGCALKAFPTAAVAFLTPFNGMHRYLPAVFQKGGLTIGEVSVNHRPRQSGKSKYTNLDRALRGIYDLVGVGWLLRRQVFYPPVETKNKPS